MVMDLMKELPFSEGEFTLVYNSHVIEHFPKAFAPDFLRECFRVLKPKGILRVVVPDLRSIVQQYLVALEKAEKGSSEWGLNYEWILLEMFDQVVRNQPGGEMAKYRSRKNLQNEDYIIGRCGIEAKRIIEKNRMIPSEPSSDQKNVVKKSFFGKLYRLLRFPEKRQELLEKIVLKEEYDTLQLGRFRKSGEIHQWMYDSYSLARVIRESGFVGIEARSATASYLPNWSDYNLDTEPDGKVYKPDSLYMEAIRP